MEETSIGGWAHNSLRGEKSTRKQVRKGAFAVVQWQLSKEGKIANTSAHQAEARRARTVNQTKGVKIYIRLHTWHRRQKKKLGQRD